MTYKIIDDGQIKITSESIARTFVSTIKLGEEFQNFTPDGRKVKTVGYNVVTISTTFNVQVVTLTADGTLVTAETATKDGEKDSTVTREVVDDGQVILTVS